MRARGAKSFAMKNIGEMSKEFREAKKWNTTRMAKEVGTSRQNIEHLESRGSITPHYVADLARVMGTTVDALISGRAAATITFTAAAIGSTAAPTVTSLDKRKEQRRSPAPGEVIDSLVSLLEKCDAAARDGLAGALPGLARDPSDPRAITAVKAWLSPHEAARSKQANG